MKALVALAAIGVALFGLATPATAVSLNMYQVGTIFCFARLSGDMAPVLAILTDDLGKLVAAATARSGADSIPWQSDPKTATTCEMVGASGTADAPQVVLSYGFDDPAAAGFSDRIVARSVDQRLRIDDVSYAGSGTLREKLGAP